MPTIPLKRDRLIDKSKLRVYNPSILLDRNRKNFKTSINLHQDKVRSKDLKTWEITRDKGYKTREARVIFIQIEIYS